VRLIDTAEFYGPGTSERLIAEALHPYPEGLVIATKGLTHPPDRWLPIPGTSSVAHLEENLAAAALRLTEDEFQLLGPM
jgi:aryl-alcohol dehydrogenase-like predicted oxidoreductase